MKNIFLPLFVAALLFTACGDAANTPEAGTIEEETATGTPSSGDPIKDQVQALLDIYKKGCKPGISMAEIVKHDPEAESFEVDGKATGNLECSYDDEAIDAQRFYSKKYADKTKLDKIRFMVNRVYGDDYEGGPIPIDIVPLAALIETTLGTKGTKGKAGYTDENTFYWKKDGIQFSLDPGEDYITIYVEPAK